MSSQTTVLTDIFTYDPSNMIFAVPQESTVNAVKYKRIPISTRNPDGSVGDLIIRTCEVFSFGVQETKSPETEKVTGYSMPLCLWNRNGPTDEEIEWIRCFELVVEKCKEHLVANGKLIGRRDLEMRDLRTFSPIYRKRNEEGEIIETRGPLLYPKVILSRKNNKENILTIFYDSSTNTDLNLIDIINKACTTVAAIKIESIFIGNGAKTLSLQIKIWEADCKIQQSGVKRLLLSSSFTPQQSSNNSYKPVSPTLDEKDDDSGSIANSEDEEEQQFVPKLPPKILEPTTRKVAQRKMKPDRPSNATSVPTFQ